MSLTGPGDGDPYRLGVAIADISAGMFAAQGITLALLVRERTGKGQFVDIGMLDSVASLLTYQAGIYFTAGRTPTRMGNRHPSIAPYDTLAAEDGTLVLAVGNDAQWRTFCRVAGLTSLAEDARFATNAARVEHYEDLRPLIARMIRTRSRQEWIDRLVPAGVPCAAVRGLDEVLTDPQLAAREMIQAVAHPTAGTVKVLGVPIKLSDTPGGVHQPPPRLGEHTAAVLQQRAGPRPGGDCDTERRRRHRRRGVTLSCPWKSSRSAAASRSAWLTSSARAAERREKVAAAERAYESFLANVATPTVNAVAQSLSAEGYPYKVTTPGKAVRMVSDRSGRTYLEIRLDTAGPAPQLVAEVGRERGSRILADERPICQGMAIEAVTDEDLLAAILDAMAELIER